MSYNLYSWLYPSIIYGYTGVECKAHVTQRTCNYIIMVSIRNLVLVLAVLAMGLGAIGIAV